VSPDGVDQSLSELRQDLPLSIALGAGGARGMAHLGVLEVLAERRFRITEMVGASVGALITAFYAAVGLDLPAMRVLGLNLTSRHLLIWAWLRRAPGFIGRRFASRAGVIPEYLERLAATPGDRLHHGVERIGLVAYDLNRREELLFHNLQPDFPLDAATRGAVAIPRFYPPKRCVVGGRELRLIDGGVTNRLPVDKLFAPPFRPAQVLVVDISNRVSRREENLAKVRALRRRHPAIPVAVIRPNTLGKGTVIYGRKEMQELIDSGRRVAEELFSSG
jgi:NTE family protein